MKTLRILAAVAGLALAASLVPEPAFALSQYMCAPPRPGTTQARRVTNPNTSNSYNLNSFGCADIGYNDQAYFASQGFNNQGGGTFSLLFFQQTTGFTFTVPASAFIRNIIFSEVTGNSVASGICIGSTTYGTSDVATMTGAASTLKPVSDSSMAKRVFSISAAQAIYVDSCADTGFSSAKYDVTVEMGFF